MRDVPRAVQIAALAALYVLAGKLGLSLAFVHASASPVWPPTGIALAALLVLGYRVWPAIAVGAFLVNLTTAGSVATSLAIAGGNTLEALVGAALVNRFAGGRAFFDRTRDTVAFMALAALAGPAVSATVGVTALSLAGFAGWADYASIWTTWWLGDAAGALLVAPPLVLWSDRRGLPELRRRAAEAIGAVATVIAVGLVVFGSALPPAMRRAPIAFFCIPPLLWAPLRFGPRMASTAVLALSGIAVAGTLRGYGPFAVASPNVALLLLQAFMATMAVTMLSVAALVWERTRAEASIRASEERLRVAVEAGRMGTWEWNVATGVVTWSPGLEILHGLQPGTFAGTIEAFEAAIHPEDRQVVRAGIRDALAGGLHRVEYRIVPPDGALRWVESRGEVLLDAGGRPARLVGVCLDVSDRKGADDERARLLGQERSARLRAEAAEQRVAVLGEIARSISATLDLDTVLHRIVEGASRLCRSDSAAIFLGDAGSDTMTARTRVGTWRGPDDAVSEREAGSQRGWPVSDARGDARIRRGEGPGGQVMLTGRPVRTEARMVVPIVIRAELAGLLDVRNASARGFSDEDEAVCVNLAEQAAIAIQNARLFAQQESGRAEAEAENRGKDEFLAMLGHELRNPLGALTNAAHVLGLEAARPEQRARAQQIIVRQLRHLGRLVDDLLDVSRVVAGKIVLHRQPLDLAEVVRQAVAALRRGDRLAEHRLSVDTEPAWVDADAVRLDQVVTNLLANAAKYTPSGGDIEVTVRTAEDTAVLSIRDSGIGIPAELVPRVFDLFVQGDHTLDRAQGGLGIGLTLVRQLVELHGGSVEALSDGPGRGSRFTIRLAAATSGARVAAGEGAAATASRRVLVVEDGDDAREMLCTLVRLLGHEVHEATAGAAGVEAALRLTPDVTLVDIGLPGIDGYEVARTIRAHPVGKTLRLVALTGYGLGADRERALAAGFDLHLVKPVEADTLRALLAAPPEDPARR